MLIKILATIHLEIFVQGLEKEAERGGESGRERTYMYDLWLLLMDEQNTAFNCRIAWTTKILSFYQFVA
jgi:hypothetical protein